MDADAEWPEGSAVPAIAAEAGAGGFLCPNCGRSSCRVADSRGRPGSRHKARRRVCVKCDHRFSTVEITRAEYDALLGSTAVSELRRKLIEAVDEHLAGRVVPRP